MYIQQNISKALHVQVNNPYLEVKVFCDIYALKKRGSLRIFGAGCRSTEPDIVGEFASN